MNARDARQWICCAKRGDFENAWTISDRIRRRDSHSDRTLPRHLQRIWDGTPLHGRRVLIRCYHGLGDSIQFSRYLPLVREIAAHVTVSTQRGLLPIFERSFQGIDFLELHDGTPDVDYDVDIEVMELPYFFRTTLESIPNRVPYLDFSAGTLPDRRLPRAQSRGLPRVGIVWRAGDWDERRSIPFEGIKRLLDQSGVEFYRVQYPSDPSETHSNLHPFPSEGVLPTAQHMRGLDLLVSVDSMPAHLAGALAIPVWTLLTHQADWRWMLDRSDSPWYPTMRLFRQPAPGAWAAVIDEVCESVSSFQLAAFSQSTGSASSA